MAPHQQVPPPAAALPAKKKAVPWLSSDAKQIMAQDMMDKIVPVKERIKNPEKLYNSLYAHREEFKEFPYNKNVPGRIKRLQATVAKLGDMAAYDNAAFARDRTLNPPSTVGYNGRLLWEGSTAARMLKIDMAAGVHNDLHPGEMVKTRPCYRAFGAERLGKRIDQLTEKAKDYGATPGQIRSGKKKSKKLPHGCKEKSRKDTQAPYDNSA